MQLMTTNGNAPVLVLSSAKANTIEEIKEEYTLEKIINSENITKDSEDDPDSDVLDREHTTGISTKPPHKVANAINVHIS